MKLGVGTYLARAHVQGDGSRSQERLDRLRSNLVYAVRDRLVGCRAHVIGGTPAQFRTCKAHYLARSIGRPKRRYIGFYFSVLLIAIEKSPKVGSFFIGLQYSRRSSIRTRDDTEIAASA